MSDFIFSQAGRDRAEAAVTEPCCLNETHHFILILSSFQYEVLFFDSVPGAFSLLPEGHFLFAKACRISFLCQGYELGLVMTHFLELNRADNRADTV